MTEIKTHNLNSFDIACWFTCAMDRDAGDSITNLKLQKLLYYAQAWSLVFNKKSLFAEDFEAWAHGPIIPSVYKYFGTYGFEAIPPYKCESDMAGDSEEVLKEVKRVYGEKSAKTLKRLVQEESPWIEARDGLPPEAKCNRIIPKTRMQSYYTQVLNDNTKM